MARPTKKQTKKDKVRNNKIDMYNDIFDQMDQRDMINDVIDSRLDTAYQYYLDKEYKSVWDSIDAKEQKYVDLFDNAEARNNIDNYINKQKNNSPDFDSFTYAKDTSYIDNKKTNDINTPPSNTDTVTNKLVMSDDMELNNSFNKWMDDGLSLEEMNTKINKGRRDKLIDEEQWKAAKDMLDQNKSYIDDTLNQRSLLKEQGEKATKEAAEQVVRRGSDEVGDSLLKKALSSRNISTVLNAGFAISDYKDAREAGNGVVGSLAKAGTQFAMGEMMGLWMLPVGLAKAAPTALVSGFEGASKAMRGMNSVSRVQTFGNAQFQDTQQLATMRQSGMELAKMSQYNLQQSLMGNEAQHLHRL